ncbi:folliculin [Glossina fuscipes]|uniref:Folliculin n=1 Tax=Glossina fuscipes TaxID=7396 RepID=A0A8U0W796_9MUSC|nr:folliculin [Glossina fuscipes]
MNAVVVLCHFCEIHGPAAIFCTQTLRDTKIDDLCLTRSECFAKANAAQCPACNSLGLINGMCSKDVDSGATFLSTQQSPFPEVETLIKQAAIRSLSCEINCNKDGGFVFFGDTIGGHVLSHTFHMSDMQARGFYQLFSIIILMKDKYFLLNIKPFLSERLRKISSEIQNCAQSIHKEEESKGSFRQRRLSGSKLSQTPRSLVELTGEKNIYIILHAHFSWLLLSGSKFLTEHITFGNLPWLPPQTSSHPPPERLTYNLNILPMIQKYENLEQPEVFYSLRHINKIVGRREFPALCYCALIGIKIIVRGDPVKTFPFMMCLKKLLPEAMHNLIRVDAQHQHSIDAGYKIISIADEIAAPMPNSTAYRIDFLDEPIKTNQVCIKWLGSIPAKWPDLLVKLVKAVEETSFTELVLNRRTKALVEEWKNKVICLSHAKNTNAQVKLKKVLGVQIQDHALINYWSIYLK